MSNKAKSIISETMCWIGIMLLTIWGTTAIVMHTYAPRYTGTEIFWTQKEYVEFKEAIVEYNGELEKATVLSSEPPIVVTFTIRTKEEAGFPYGNPPFHLPYESYWYVFLAVGGGLLTASFFIPTKDKKEEK